jgi:hypothetical protein
MPFRTMTTLESWLEEFLALGYPVSGRIRVIPQDAEEGTDTGLVAASLGSVPTVLYIEPVAHGSAAWQVTFEPRDVPASVDAAAALALSAELAVLSALCAFFQAKSEAFLAAWEG